MTLFDLVFLVVVLTTLASLCSAAVTAARGTRRTAFRHLRRLALGLAAYMGLVTLVSLVMPRGVVALGEDQCSDDWCIAVVSASYAPHGPDTRVDVRFRLISRARRASQRERFVVAYLVDPAGHRYDAQPVAGGVPFDTLLGPGEALVATRSFYAPPATELEVVVAREGDLAFPRCCIIGQGPFFEYPTVRLAVAAAAS